jgi:hypothetical protein
LAEEGADESPEKLRITKRLMISVESEFGLPEGLLQPRHKFAAKHAAEDLDGEEEGIAGRIQRV